MPATAIATQTLDLVNQLIGQITTLLADSSVSTPNELKTRSQIIWDSAKKLLTENEITLCQTVDPDDLPQLTLLTAEKVKLVQLMIALNHLKTPDQEVRDIQQVLVEYEQLAPAQAAEVEKIFRQARNSVLHTILTLPPPPPVDLAGYVKEVVRGIPLPQAAVPLHDLVENLQNQSPAAAIEAFIAQTNPPQPVADNLRSFISAKSDVSPIASLLTPLSTRLPQIQVIATDPDLKPARAEEFVSQLLHRDELVPSDHVASLARQLVTAARSQPDQVPKLALAYESVMAAASVLNLPPTQALTLTSHLIPVLDKVSADAAQLSHLITQTIPELPPAIASVIADTATNLSTTVPPPSAAAPPTSLLFHSTLTRLTGGSTTISSPTPSQADQYISLASNKPPQTALADLTQHIRTEEHLAPAVALLKAQVAVGLIVNTPNITPAQLAKARFPEMSQLIQAASCIAPPQVQLQLPSVFSTVPAFAYDRLIATGATPAAAAALNQLLAVFQPTASSSDKQLRPLITQVLQNPPSASPAPPSFTSQIRDLSSSKTWTSLAPVISDRILASPSTALPATINLYLALSQTPTTTANINSALQNFAPLLSQIENLPPAVSALRSQLLAQLQSAAPAAPPSDLQLLADHLTLFKLYPPAQALPTAFLTPRLLNLKVADPDRLIASLKSILSGFPATATSDTLAQAFLTAQFLKTGLDFPAAQRAASSSLPVFKFNYYLSGFTEVFRTSESPQHFQDLQLQLQNFLSALKDFRSAQIGRLDPHSIYNFFRQDQVYGSPQSLEPNSFFAPHQAQPGHLPNYLQYLTDQAQSFLRGPTADLWQRFAARLPEPIKNLLPRQLQGLLKILPRPSAPSLTSLSKVTSLKGFNALLSQSKYTQIGLKLFSPFKSALSTVASKAFAKFAASAVGKAIAKFAASAVVRVGAKIALKLGLNALLQAIGTSLPVIGNIIAFVAGWLIEKAAGLAFKLAKFLKEYAPAAVAFLLVSAGGFVAGLGGVTSLALGGAAAVGTQLIAATLTGAGAGIGLLTGIGSTVGSIISSIAGDIVVAAFTPVLIAVLAIPVLVALFLFIINSGAYIVPPSLLAPIGSPGGPVFLPPIGSTYDCSDTGNPVVAPGATVRLLPETNRARVQRLCITPTEIVIHWSGGWNGVNGTYNALASRDVACQYATDENETLQMEIMWERKVEFPICANNHNPFSINIEMSGLCFSEMPGICSGINTPPPETEIKRTVDLVCWLKRQYNINTVIGHYEIPYSGKSDPGEKFLYETFLPRVNSQCP